MLKRNAELRVTKEELIELKEQMDEPWFTWDQLERGPHVRAITELLEDNTGNFVMTLSSPWGTGKTTFMHMWKAYLEYKSHPCIMFNAWENDYAENPFLTFIAEMHSQLLALGGEGTEERERLLNRLKDAGKTLFPRLLSFGVKAGLGVTVDFEELGKKYFGDADGEESKEFGKAFTKAMSASVEAYAKDVMDEHSKTKDLVNDFKDLLGDVIDDLPGISRPLFFFVDELDRCKPTYAVELLEAVKHLFETEGIIFVLSLDREQLGHSVRAAYGEGMDADGYLRRFIDLEYMIPEPDKTSFVRHIAVMYGIDGYPVFEDNPDGFQSFLDEFTAIGQWHHLRVIEKAMLRGSVLLKGLRPVPGNNACLKCCAHHIFLRELCVDTFKKVKESGHTQTLDASLWGDKLKGINPQSLEMLHKHKKDRVNTPLGGGFTMENVVPQSSGLADDAVFAYHFNNKYQRHLIDDVYKLLDLSESLVPREETGQQ